MKDLALDIFLSQNLHACKIPAEVDLTFFNVLLFPLSLPLPLSWKYTPNERPIKYNFLWK